MAKDICRALGLDTLINEFEMAQLAQLALERSRARPHRAQQAVREFPTDYGGGLKELFRFVRQPIDARHHDLMDRVRHHEIGSNVLYFTCMQRELLQKERVTVGLGNDFLRHQVDEALGAEYRPNHLQA